MFEKLKEIHDLVIRDPKNVTPEIRTHFWKLVGQIKRTPHPDQEIVAKASEIRDLLYEQRLGRTFSLKVMLPIWGVLAIGCFIGYIWSLEKIAGNDLICFKWNSHLLGGFVVFGYPLGRFVAGTLMGIRFDGMSRDIYYLPTLKINYYSYLMASPPKRQWMFLLAGMSTVFTSGVAGTLGFVMARDATGLLLCAFLVVSYILVIAFPKQVGRWRGEMGHFYRERNIVRDWKRKLASLTNS
ncbi:MAG: hypothetical protein ACE5R6_08420 [Candidatus Heimdallarchaeota archaeon]